MKFFYLLVIILFSSITGATQNIQYFEYYFDEDPGYNLAMPISIDTAPECEISFVVPTNSLSKGFHTIGMRGKDSNGNWSIDHTGLFYLDLLQIEGSPITHCEYFIDTDPGFGQATSVPVCSGTVINPVFEISLNGINPGFHIFTLRSQSENGTWSQNYNHIFMVNMLSSGSETITRVEYFIDNDPGFGQATSVPVSSGTVINPVFEIPLNGINPGFHILTLRSKSENGTWSQNYNHIFMVNMLSSGSETITRVEYFIDNDPGFGQATSVPVSSGTVINPVFEIPLNGINPGFHMLTLRSQSENGTWSQNYNHIFLVNMLSSGSESITRVEYFIDNDPGFGQATSIEFTSSAEINLYIFPDISELQKGVHNLTIRAQSENGHWSEAHNHAFFINSFSHSFNPGLDKLECFVDFDPGFGQGQTLTINPPVAVSDCNILVNLDSVQPGIHLLYSRAQDEYENWSIVSVDTFNLTPDSDFALHFDGIDDFLEVGNLSFPVNDFTLEAWINPNEISGNHAIVYGYGENDGIQFFIQSDGSLAYGESENEAWKYVFSPSGLIVPGYWSHVAITRYGNICTLFLNGNQIGTGTISCIPEMDQLSFGGQRNSFDGYFNGDIDEIRLWSLARSQIEIHNNRCTDFRGNESGIAGLWHFNDGPGNQTASDSGPGFSHALLNNMNPLSGLSCSWIEHSCNVDNHILIAEYYIDTDPGFGSGIPINQTPNSTEFNFYADLNGLESGLHNLYIRTRNETGSWSQTIQSPFLVQSVQSEPFSQMAYCEYFIDIDPGISQGTQLFFEPNSGSTMLTFGIPLQGLQPGTSHILYIRSVDASGKWSMTVNAGFSIEEPPLVAEFTSDMVDGYVPLTVQFTDLSSNNPCSWQWDFGDGNISNIQNPSHTFTIPGSYNISLSVSNPAGYDTELKPNYITVFEPLYTLEYFFNCDPGYGNGHQVYNYNSNSEGFEFVIPLQNIDCGTHILYTRIKDTSDIWTHTLSHPIVVISLPDDPLRSITRLEYFIDFDPGPGNGSLIFIPNPSSSVNSSFLVNLSGHSPGQHYLLVRAMDESGNWSIVYNSVFSVEQSLGVVHLLELPEGWSGISSYLIPENSMLDSLFSPIIQDLSIIQNFEGIYWPGQNINTLLNWNEHQGYQIKMMSNSQLELFGQPQSDLHIDLNSGWNYLPVLSSCHLKSNSIFNQVSDQLKIVKEIAGCKIYWPQFNIYTLDTIFPGKAYFINVDENVSFNYPDCATIKSSSKLQDYSKTPRDNHKLPNEVLGLNIHPYPTNHLIALPENVLSGFQLGDVIGVFAEDGKCYGAIPYNHGNIALTVFGDDPTTPEIDGIVEGEPISLTLLRPSVGLIRLINVEFDPGMPDSGSFVGHGLSAIKHLEIFNAGGISYTLKVNAFPNPSGGLFYITWNKITEHCNWYLSNAHGFDVESGLAYQDFQIDISSLSEGVYFLKVLAGESQAVIKLILNY